MSWNQGPLLTFLDMAASDPAHAAVDGTLIAEMRKMTVRQRLEQNDRASRAAQELRRAFAASQSDKPGR
jgi:hypothetical protein